MKPHPLECRTIASLALSLWAVALPGLLLLPSAASAQKFVIKPVAEKKLNVLPVGPWYWQLENFPTLALAKAAEGPLSLAAEISGKVWLFTLGPKGAPTHGGTKVTEIGPIPPVAASEYLLRINHASGPPGARRQCIRIRVRKRFMSSRAGLAKGRRTASAMPTLVSPCPDTVPTCQWKFSARARAISIRS